MKSEYFVLLLCQACLQKEAFGFIPLSTIIGAPITDKFFSVLFVARWSRRTVDSWNCRCKYRSSLQIKLNVMLYEILHNSCGFDFVYSLQINKLITVFCGLLSTDNNKTQTKVRCTTLSRKWRERFRRGITRKCEGFYPVRICIKCEAGYGVAVITLLCLDKARDWKPCKRTSILISESSSASLNWRKNLTKCERGSIKITKDKNIIR